MEDKKKRKEQLISELIELRQKIAELEKSKTETNYFVANHGVPETGQKHENHLEASFGALTGEAIKQENKDKERLQIQFLHTQKIESINQLSNGIVHDFNNIISSIMGCCSILKIKIDKDDPRIAYVESILASSIRAADLTQSILTFSSKQTIELKPCKVNVIIKTVEKLLRRLLTEDISMELILDNADTTIMADKSQIDRVLMNLATNAQDAMPGGGKFIIKTKRVTLGSDFFNFQENGKPGDYALISVKDTGAGMDEKTKEQIFHPFFTTKDIGRGTGLGLSMVYEIVKQHNGFIDVQSSPGSGTTFNIYIPETKITKDKDNTGIKEIEGGTETILLVEDDEELRNITRVMLGMAGYTVIIAVDGEDALRKFFEHEGKISLLILDVVMPKINGKEVHKEIKKIDPHIKVLFTSGHISEIVVGKGIFDKTVNFIQKPFISYDFLTKIREILNNNSQE